MPLSNASRLADFGTGIGTAGAIIQVDNANQRLGVGTTSPTATLGVAGIVSATAFYGDGSNLEGVASAGLGTAVDDTKDSIGQNIYYTNDELTIYENTTIDAPATSDVAYTQYQQVTVESGKELIVADGDTFIPDVLGIGTGLQASTAGAGNGLFGTVYVDNIENVAGRGGPNFPLGITVSGISTLSGNVSIGGTLTYEDVTNVDSIGIVTARNGIKVTTGGIDVTAGAIVAGAGVNVTSGNVHVGQGGAGSNNGELKIQAGASTGNDIIAFLNQAGSTRGNITYDTDNNFVLFNVNAGEKLRIGSAGQIGLAGANYGTSGQVITSQGGSAAPQWATPAGGAWTVLSHDDFSTTPASFTESRGWTSDYMQVKCAFSYINWAEGTSYQNIGIRFYTDTSLGQQGTLHTSADYKRTILGIQQNSTSIGGCYTNTGDNFVLKSANNSSLTAISGELIFPIATVVGNNSTLKTCTASFTNLDGWAQGYCRLNNSTSLIIVGARMYNAEGTPNNWTQGRVTWYGLKKS